MQGLRNLVISIFSLVSAVPLEDSLVSDRLTFLYTIEHNGKVFQALVLFDTGASGYVFIDHEFAQTYSLPMIPLRQPRILEGFDGKPTAAGPIQSYIEANFRVPDRPFESINFFVTSLPQVPIILGLPWIQKYNTNISLTRT